MLFLHESIYFSARNYANQTDSRNTRTLVGKLINSSPVNSNEIQNLLAVLGMSYGRKSDNFLSTKAEAFVAATAPEL